MSKDNEDLTLIENVIGFDHEEADSTDVDTKLKDFDFSKSSDLKEIEEIEEINLDDENEPPDFNEEPPQFEEENKALPPDLLNSEETLDLEEQDDNEPVQFEENLNFESIDNFSDTEQVEKQFTETPIEETETTGEFPMEEYLDENKNEIEKKESVEFTAENALPPIDQDESSFINNNDDPPLSFSSNIDHFETETVSTKEEVVREDFNEVKEFGKNIASEDTTIVADPPFAIILKNIKYKEDATEIIRILRKHKVMDSNNESTLQNGVESGSVLISQLSEFVAITLAHQFRTFDLEIQFGLVEELHNSKTYETNSKGLINKQILKINRSEEFDLEKSSIKIDSIILSTSPTLSNYEIVKYIDVISNHMVVDLNEFITDRPLDELLKIKNVNSEDKTTEVKKDKEKGPKKIDHIYNKLLSLMREKAFILKGNAIVDINFQSRPVSLDLDNLLNEADPEKAKEKNLFKVSCIGNVVWVNDID